MPDYLEEIAELVPGRRVVSYDQRGTGSSVVTDGDYSTEAHVADLDMLREHLGVEQLHLFGHSWGGLLAQLYAAEHLSSVASLFLCSPTPGVGATWVAMERDVMAYGKKRSSSRTFAMLGLRSLLGRIPRLGQRSLRKMYARSGSTTRTPSALGRQVCRCSKESGGRRLTRLGPPRYHFLPTCSPRFFLRPRFRFLSYSVKTTSTVNTRSSSSSARQRAGRVLARVRSPSLARRTCPFREPAQVVLRLGTRLLTKPTLDRLSGQEP